MWGNPYFFEKRVFFCYFLPFFGLIVLRKDIFIVDLHNEFDETMKYFEITFTVTPLSEVATDVLSALAADAGCESFVPTETGLTAYCQQSLWNGFAMQESLASFPIKGVEITYHLQEAEDKDWNEEWEKNAFKPVYIDNRCVIHDTEHTDVLPMEYDIIIRPQLAFGTGTHETTGMLVHTLMDFPLEGKRVLDAGCGTGILGILASMRGAKEVLSYDIDEWSTENTKLNAKLNGVKNLRVVTGDSGVLSNGGAYAGKLVDVLIANINLNILKQDFARFRSALRPGGCILMSGFYTTDIPELTLSAEVLGLHLVSQRSNGEWAMVTFQ
jgi:ribosomal protein L11 methyltransferase